MSKHCHSLATAAVATLVLAAATAAGAAPLRINTGADFNFEPDGSTRTAVFDGFSQSGSLQTRIYLGAADAVGTTVISTNIPSIQNFYGFTAGTHTTLDGGSASFTYASAPSQNNFDALSNPASSDLNGFSNGLAFPQYGAGAVGGLGGAWGLTFSYQLVGTTVDTNNDTLADAISYSTGVVSVYYQSAVTDPNNGKEVLRLIINGSSAAGVFGQLDYSYAGGDSFIQNFLEDVAAGSTLYSQWLGGAASTSFALDFPSGIDGSSALWNSGSSLIAQSLFDGQLTLNPSVVAAVPEPGSLLLGLLALGGLAASRRRAAPAAGR